LSLSRINEPQSSNLPTKVHSQSMSSGA